MHPTKKLNELIPGDVVWLAPTGRPDSEGHFDCVTHVTDTGIFIGDRKFSRSTGGQYYGVSALVSRDQLGGISIRDVPPRVAAILDLRYKVWSLLVHWESWERIPDKDLAAIAGIAVTAIKKTKKRKRRADN